MIGLSAQITKYISIFGTADYNVGLDRSIHGFGGQLGLKIGW